MTSSWHILGAGSMGCLFASELHLTGCTTTLLVRDTALPGREIQRQVEVKVHSGIETLQHKLPASSAGDSEYIRHLLVTTKAYDVVAALSSVIHRLDKNSHILLLINGMGVLEELEALYPQLTFYCGTTTEGAYRSGEREIVYAGTGTTKIGRGLSVHPPKWFQDWRATNFACQWEEDINAALWQKLAVNCAINPLTALARCTNNGLQSTPELEEQLLPLCHEIALISAAAGHDQLADNLQQLVYGVIEKTGNNRSSMLQDVLAGRRTEIDYISGYLLTVARRLKIPAPINQKLLEDVKKITH